MHLIYYFWYVCRHKWFVMMECWRYGLFLTGVIHDWDKFLPGEFLPYARYFYKWGGKDVPSKVGTDFQLAWLQHQKLGKHHWQWWVMYQYQAEKGAVVLDIPIRYLKEMVADWKGAGRAKLGKSSDTVKWYLENREHMILSECSRRVVEMLLCLPDHMDYLKKETGR